MFGKGMTRFASFAFAISVLLAISVASLAGGFQLEVEVPTGSADADLKDAVLLVRTYGCHTPSNAHLSATAEGMVNGARQSIPLKLTLTQTGVYAIKQQWPSDGKWVLAITGEYNGLTSSALVGLGQGGVVKAISADGKTPPVRVVRRKLTASEIDSAIKTGRIAQAFDSETRDVLYGESAKTWAIAGAGSVLFLAGFVAFKRLARA
jgi:hypothetical protein